MALPVRKVGLDCSTGACRWTPQLNWGVLSKICFRKLNSAYLTQHMGHMIKSREKKKPNHSSLSSFRVVTPVQVRKGSTHGQGYLDVRVLGMSVT